MIELTEYYDDDCILKLLAFGVIKKVEFEV